MQPKGAYKVSGTNKAVFAQTRLELELRRVQEGLALNERRACTPTPRGMQDKTLTAFVTVIEEPAHNGEGIVLSLTLYGRHMGCCCR